MGWAQGAIVTAHRVELSTLGPFTINFDERKRSRGQFAVYSPVQTGRQPLCKLRQNVCPTVTKIDQGLETGKPHHLETTNSDY